jgi:hypothetical protein
MATINYFATTNAAGMFALESTGRIQGTLDQNPVENFKIAGGSVATSETLPMWGGVLIKEYMPTYPSTSAVPNFGLGGTILRATSISDWTGFCVFDQAQAGVNWPQSPVPTYAPGTSCNFVRKGSGVRLAVQCDPSLVSFQAATVIPASTSFSWDFNNQCLQPYDAATATYNITSLTWSSTNGGQVAVVMGAATPVAAVGDIIYISGVTTNSGTGGIAAINGTQYVNTFTDSQHFTFLLPGTSAQWGTIGLSSGHLNYGVGDFGAGTLTVLGIFPGNSMVVDYNTSTGNAVWNRSGCTAVIIV